MTVFHFTLVSAFTVSQSKIAEKEPQYLAMIEKLLKASSLFNGGH